jgi:hypothetical protein
MTASAVINGALFNISWLAIVYTHSARWALLFTAAHLVLHFRLMGRGIAEARLILTVALFGVLLDQLLFALGVFTIRGTPGFPPVWISCLWPVLATTLMHAFRGLQQHVFLAMALGGLGGASSYLAGTALTDVQFGSSVWGPLIMATLWTFLLPALLGIARDISTEPGSGQHAQRQ